MSILERDRAAAYFADEEFGAQVLSCSENGSEGRNFQFAHHSVLSDLPSHPDLLEQRAGRLDGIGQKHTTELARKRVQKGKSMYVRVALGGPLNITNNTTYSHHRID